MNTSAFIDCLGGTVAVAEICGVTKGAVSQWRNEDVDQIPKAHRKFFALHCPDLWREYIASREKADA